MTKCSLHEYKYSTFLLYFDVYISEILFIPLDLDLFIFYTLQPDDE